MAFDTPKLTRVALLLAGLWLTGCSFATARPAPEPESALDTRDMVVLLHGLGRSSKAMWRLEDRLIEAGFRVRSLSYDSTHQPSDVLRADIARQMADCCLERGGRLHFIGHSLGGLMVRAYLADHPVPNLGRVVVMGTPNGGSELVDRMGKRWWFSWLGPTASELGTDAESFPASLPAPDYPVGVIAGRATSFLSSERFLPGADDGMVSLRSTRLKGMQDFAIVDARHSALRSNEQAAEYAVNFLRSGRFSGRPDSVAALP